MDLEPLFCVLIVLGVAIEATALLILDGRDFLAHGRAL